MRACFILVSLMMLAVVSRAQSFQQWLTAFKPDAISQGIHSSFFDKTFRGMTLGRRQIHFDRTQPETRLTYLAYRNKRAGAYRTKLGQREYKKRRKLFHRISEEYGVSPCYIVSIWGLETSYGRYMGGFSVVRSLATLAYEGRRAAFFKRELIYALHILQAGHVSPKQFKGEWAVGSGHPQFLPSSWYRYAVDYNQDSRRDIWTTYSDAFASIANYLKLNGWRVGEPTRVAVVLPSHFDATLLGLRVKKTVEAWRALGVRVASGWPMPEQYLTASIVQLYGGPALMVFKNSRVIKTYNASNFYAGTVSYMADNICRR